MADQLNTSIQSPVAINCPVPDEDGDFFAFVFDTVIVGTLCVIGIIANSIAVASFLKGRVNSTSMLLIALAVSDTLYLSTHGLMFQALRSIYPYTGAFKAYMEAWPYIEVWEFPFGVTFQTLSIYFVLLVAFDRYIGVCWPLNAKVWCTKPRTMMQLVIVTVFAFGLNVPRFFIQKPIERYDNCSESIIVVMVADRLGKSRLFNMIMGPVYLTLIDILPNCVLIIINFRLVWAIRQSYRLRASFSSKTKPDHRGERKTTVMLCVVIVVFLLCQTPISVNHLLYAIQMTMEPSSQRYYNILTNSFAAINSTINFFIYVLLGPKFRDQLKSLFKCKADVRRRMSSATLQSTLSSYTSSRKLSTISLSSIR